MSGERTVRAVGRLVLLVAALGYLVLGCGPAPDARVRVEAGDQTRRFIPVSAEIDVSTVNGDEPVGPETSVCARDHTGKEFAAQIGPVENGRATVWWVIDFLAAGNTKTYDLHVGRSCGEGTYAWGEPGDTTTVISYEERAVLEYVHPTFDPEDIEHTKKPFHHVYAPDGSRRITKGQGGLYSHHRGLFFGYNQVQIAGDTLDVWHGADGEHQQHVEVLESWEGPVLGGHTVRIHWNDREGEPFAEEIRTVRTFHQPDGRLLVEFETRLRTERDTVLLEGDRQHAGVQFRAAQAVAQNAGETRFLRPDGWCDLPRDQEINDSAHVDLPWNAIQFPLDGRPYTVAYLSDPANPDGAYFSERRYGRFGEYFPWTLTEENPLHARYRWAIFAGQQGLRGEISRYYEQLAEPVEVQVVE